MPKWLPLREGHPERRLVTPVGPRVGVADDIVRLEDSHRRCLGVQKPGPHVSVVDSTVWTFMVLARGFLVFGCFDIESNFEVVGDHEPAAGHHNMAPLAGAEVIRESSVVAVTPRRRFPHVSVTTPLKTRSRETSLFKKAEHDSPSIGAFLAMLASVRLSALPSVDG